MSVRFFRKLAIGLVPIILTACMSPDPAAADRGDTASVPLGVDLGRSGSESPPRPRGPPSGGHRRTTDLPAGTKMAHEGHNGAPATGTENPAHPPPPNP